MTGRDHARIALAAIRLVNGTMALLTPKMMLRRLGADPAANQVAIYPLRMFGVRTVVLGVDLLAGGSMQQKGRVGVIIHATDAASAITAGLRRQLPARVALVAAGISLTNTALAAIIAQPERTSEPAAPPASTPPPRPRPTGPGNAGRLVRPHYCLIRQRSRSTRPVRAVKHGASRGRLPCRISWA